MLLKLLFILWGIVYEIRPHLFAFPVLPSLLLPCSFTWSTGNGELELTAVYWGNIAKLLLLQNVQQLVPCQTEPLILQLVPVQRNIRCISSFVERATSDLGQAAGMENSEQHWRQGKNGAEEVVLAGYSY